MTTVPSLFYTKITEVIVEVSGDPNQSSSSIGSSYMLFKTCVFKMSIKKSNLSVGFVQGNTERSTEERRFFQKIYIQKFKSIAGHVGLLIALMLYTAIGGLVSQNFKHMHKKRILNK